MESEVNDANYALMGFTERVNLNRREPSKHLSMEQRRVLFDDLLKQSVDGKLKKSSISIMAAWFGVSKRTVRRLWNRASELLEQGIGVDFGRIYQQRGPSKKKIQIEADRIIRIPKRRRKNIRSFAKAYGVSKTTLHRRIKDSNMIRPHTNAIKPHLTEENKRSRLQFCLSMLQQGTLSSNLVFHDMFNVVHIDEKWFYLSKSTERYYLHPSEIEPHRTCKSKRFISKVMFLAAVARPNFDGLGNCQFTGKIGIFPFVVKEPARRNSKNRVAGTLETKPILSVTKEVTRTCLIEKVLPAIRAKWPDYRGKTIFIQQDNAKPHIDPDDDQFLQAATTDGFHFHLYNQPPNSPDMNVLDLGFFRAIQSLQYQEAPKTIDELVAAVEKSFDELTPETLNNVFLTWQCCMIEVMKVNGGNKYKLPHINKHRLERNGQLPYQIECDAAIAEQAWLQLQGQGEMQ